MILHGKISVTYWIDMMKAASSFDVGIKSGSHISNHTKPVNNVNYLLRKPFEWNKWGIVCYLY